MSSTQDLSLAFTKASADAMEVAMRIAKKAEQAEKAAADRIGPALQALKSAGLITDSRIKTATAQLGNHAQTLEILCNVVDHYTKKASAQEKAASHSLGAAADVSPKPQPVKKGGYVGMRRGYDDVPSEADAALRRLIGK